MRDELGCGCRANAEACIDTLRSTRPTQSRRGNGEDRGFAELLWRSSLKEDHQELKTREHQRMVEDAKRICRIVHENDKNKG